MGRLRKREEAAVLKAQWDKEVQRRQQKLSRKIDDSYAGISFEGEEKEKEVSMTKATYKTQVASFLKSQSAMRAAREERLQVEKVVDGYQQGFFSKFGTSA